MKKTLFALTALLTVTTTQAALIQPGFQTTLPNSGEETEELAIVTQFFPGEDPNDFFTIYRVGDGGGTQVGSSTGFTINPIGGWPTNDVEISWNLTGLDIEVWAVVGKQGGQIKNTLWEVEDTMRVILDPETISTPAQQTFSHISFIGKRSQPTTPGGNVPDAAAGMAYAGIALSMAFASARRRRAA